MRPAAGQNALEIRTDDPFVALLETGMQFEDGLARTTDQASRFVVRHGRVGTDATVSHHEARCLVRCARKAILELHPGFEQRYERIVRPYFERVLASRWPHEQALDDDCCDVVN